VTAAPIVGGTEQAGRPAPATPQRDELPRQLVATRYLVLGCERALFDLRCALGRTDNPGEVRVGLGAVEFLEEVLLGWRDALAGLEAAAGAGGECLPAVHGR